jgi:formylglycine-generating enzyme required for sulfatase activity
MKTLFYVFSLMMIAASCEQKSGHENTEMISQKQGEAHSESAPVPALMGCLKVGDSYVLKDLNLKLMYIPSGKFSMGSPDNEKKRSHSEFQHQVILTPINLRKYFHHIDLQYFVTGV